MKWPEKIADARAEQEHLRRKVKITPYRGALRYVAGVDAAFSDERVFGAACLYRFPELTLVEEAYAARKLLFPYVPGYLSFREGPAIIAALEKLSRRPDIILFDGQGIAHPRGMGIATHIGILLGLPSIGCAKTRLIGGGRVPGSKKGQWSELNHEGMVIGAILRTRDRVRPVYVSPGHLVDLDDAIRIVFACTGRYRIPEPLRCADALSRQARKT